MSRSEELNADEGLVEQRLMQDLEEKDSSAEIKSITGVVKEEDTMGNQTRRRAIGSNSGSTLEASDAHNLSGSPTSMILVSSLKHEVLSPCEHSNISSHSDSANESNESDFSFIGPFGKKQKVIRERLKSGESNPELGTIYEQSSSPKFERKQKTLSDSPRRQLTSNPSSPNSSPFKKDPDLLYQRRQQPPLPHHECDFEVPLNLSFSSDDNIIPNYMGTPEMVRGPDPEDRDGNSNDGNPNSPVNRGNIQQVTPPVPGANAPPPPRPRGRPRNTPPQQQHQISPSNDQQRANAPRGRSSHTHASLALRSQPGYIPVRKPGRPTNASYDAEAAGLASRSLEDPQSSGGSNNSSPSSAEKTKNKKSYACKYCDKTFSQLRNYRYHLSRHEGTALFACTCEVCGKTFNDKGYLSSHMKIHRNAKEYKCDYCDKCFNQRVAYNMHIRIHTGHKPHECHICKKAFSRKMLLRQHLRTHTGERPYKCSVCSKSFADRSNMLLHQRLHTGDRPYKCNLCHKTFSKNHHLKTHINHHLGVRPYACSLCGSCFSQSSNMKTHMKKCNGTKKDTTPGPSASVAAAAAAAAALGNSSFTMPMSGPGPSSSRRAVPSQRQSYSPYNGSAVSSSSPDEAASVDYLPNSLHTGSVHPGNLMLFGSGVIHHGSLPAHPALHRRSGPAPTATVTSENASSAQQPISGDSVIQYPSPQRHTINPSRSRGSSAETSPRQHPYGHHSASGGPLTSSPGQSRTSSVIQPPGRHMSPPQGGPRSILPGLHLTSLQFPAALVSPEQQQQLQQQYQQQMHGRSPSNHPPTSPYSQLPRGHHSTNTPSTYVPLPLGPRMSPTSPSRGLNIVPSPERAAASLVQSPHRSNRNLNEALFNQPFPQQQQHQQRIQQQQQHAQMVGLSDALLPQIAQYSQQQHQLQQHQLQLQQHQLQQRQIQQHQIQQHQLQQHQLQQHQLQQHQLRQHQIQQHQLQQHQIQQHQLQLQQPPQQQPPHQQSPHQQSPHQQSPHQQPPHQQSPLRQLPHQQSPHQQSTHQQSPQRQLPHQQSPQRQLPQQSRSSNLLDRIQQHHQNVPQQFRQPANEPDVIVVPDDSDEEEQGRPSSNRRHHSPKK